MSELKPSDIKVSVIIPAHLENASEIPWLDQAIDSALKQTYKEVEVVVVNDHSKPRLMIWPKRRHPQDNVIWAETDDATGVAAARNLGVFKSTAIILLKQVWRGQ